MTAIRPVQSRRASLLEAGTNVFVGYLLALVSLARSYVLRRLFERRAWSGRHARA